MMNIIHVPIYIIYIINGLNPVKNYIIKEMSKNGYGLKNTILNINNQETNNQKTEDSKILKK